MVDLWRGWMLVHPSASTIIPSRQGHSSISVPSIHGALVFYKYVLFLFFYFLPTLYYETFHKKKVKEYYKKKKKLYIYYLNFINISLDLLYISLSALLSFHDFTLFLMNLRVVDNRNSPLLLQNA